MTKPHPETGPGRSALTPTLLVGLALLTLAAFAPALGNGFVNWDDPANFLANPAYRGLGWPQIRWAWTTRLLDVYQPLAWMLFSAEWSRFGLDPRGYHETSLAIHVAVVLALFFVTKALLRRCLPRLAEARPAAVSLATAAAVARFAVHPLRVEAVAWASCQPYLPCALAALGSVWLYLKADDAPDGPRRLARLAGSLVLFAASTLFKAASIGLPAVLLVLDVYPLGRFARGRGEAARALAEKAAFLAVAIAAGVAALIARGPASAGSGAPCPPWPRGWPGPPIPRASTRRN